MVNCDVTNLFGHTIASLNERASNVAAQALENHQKYMQQFDALQMQTLFGRQPKPLV